MKERQKMMIKQLKRMAKEDKKNKKKEKKGKLDKKDKKEKKDKKSKKAKYNSHKVFLVPNPFTLQRFSPLCIYFIISTPLIQTLTYMQPR